MNSGDNNLAKKTIAVIVIVTLLGVVGIPPAMMLFMTGVVFIVWFVVRRSENRQLERIFEFYISADAILRDEERRLYGFEIAEVIENGERALEMMPDSPPLHYFVLGALYHQIGNYEATAEYLSRLLEDEAYDERHRTSPSPQLRMSLSKPQPATEWMSLRYPKTGSNKWTNSSLLIRGTRPGRK